MEILKKTFIAVFLILLITKLQAQTNAVLQKAFHNSYADELNKNYVAAINDIYPYYTDNSYELNIRLGWLHYLNKNYTASQSYYQKAVNLKPGAIEAKFGYVKPLSFLQSWDKVLEQYLAVLKIDQQNTQANYWAGTIYYNRKQYEAAIRYFKAVVNLYPFDYDGNHMLGWANLMAGKKADARTFFEKALIIKPADISSSEGLSKCN
ncbi:tetratricopeptide repeat protein [Mucilaginibacter sp. SP1R1]|uniref:tetratricopeptide repeat protein n=1 Tax=Mucilaginibacter sp. SP1R1 TaxID=2723091 RepID=UPI00160E8483|nr:tetratricopeptide repeat protein [Mucilaginibacter sp. SP1R1]MBB6148168.1 tetratricopeptide (TPR) repeat protein [Mucilaginibacter sp. SP1R1]